MNPILEALPKAKTWSLVFGVLCIILAVLSVLTIVTPIMLIILAVFSIQFYLASNRLEISQDADDLLKVCQAQKRFMVTQTVFGILMAIAMIIGIVVGRV